MKKLYLYITAIALTAVSGYSQNLQNANWYFGDHTGITFLPNPSTPTALSNSAMLAYEPCSTVSDQAGQLLFYTNGSNVYNKIHQPMTNGFGLIGDISNSQMAVVPRPGYPDRWYIVTMDGSSSVMNGFAHTEVDMAAGTYGEVIAANRNVFFKDHNGLNINTTYSFLVNYSEKVTTAKHCNGVDYWIVAQVKDKIYSYKVTSSGISTVPVVSTAYIGTSTASNGQGNIKISPDNKRVAICYSGTGGGVMLGSFNSFTGQVTLDPGIINNGEGSYLRLEFSPSSQYVYFTKSGNLYVTSAFSDTNTLISTGTTKVGSIERAINGKLYLTQGIIAHETHLCVLNTPDTPTSPGFQVNGVALSPGYVNGYSTLQQWIHRHGSGCDDHIVLSIPEGNATYTYQYANYIQAQNNYKIVSPSQDITMLAGNHIVLKPNVHIINGQYLGKIEDCGSSSLRLAIVACQESAITNEAEENIETFTEAELKMYPNPANDYVNFSIPGENNNDNLPF